MDPKRVSPDSQAAEIASRQHGVATLTQLLGVGLTPTTIRNRVRSGRLHRIHRGVYAVGHRGLSNEGRWMAAVLACGNGAALSHRSAAELWDLLTPTHGIVHVTVPVPGGRGKRPGLRIHRSPSLPDDATTLRNRIAVTKPARTLADLRRTVPEETFRKALREAAFRNLNLGSVEHDGTNSDLEGDFIKLCRRHRLPEPEVNARVGRFRPDFLWREQRLIVETDGYAAHRGSQAFEDDRQRDLELRAAGWVVWRFTKKQVRHEQGAVLAAVRTALTSR